MSSFVWVIHHRHCRTVTEINQAILEKDDSWPGLLGSDQLISITWDASCGMYLVCWRVRRWQEDGIWEEE